MHLWSLFFLSHFFLFQSAKELFSYLCSVLLFWNANMGFSHAVTVQDWMSWESSHPLVLLPLWLFVDFHLQSTFWASDCLGVTLACTIFLSLDLIICQCSSYFLPMQHLLSELWLIDTALWPVFFTVYPWRRPHLCISTWKHWPSFQFHCSAQKFNKLDLAFTTNCLCPHFQSSEVLKVALLCNDSLKVFFVLLTSWAMK